MSPHNRQGSPEPLTVGHGHRYRFPTPTVGSLWIVGRCECGEESKGLAFESNEYIAAANHRYRRPRKAS